MKFTEIIDGVLSGEIKSGDEFTTANGEKAIYLDKELKWVTHNGYESTAVTVNFSNMLVSWNKVDKYRREITFSEALKILHKGISTVSFELPHETYDVDNLGELEEIIEKHEYLYDMHEASIYVTGNPVIIKEEPAATPEVELATPRKGLKLTEEDAIRIHEMYHFLGKSVVDIAEHHSVTTRMIYYILDGTHWSKVHENFSNNYYARDVV